MKFYTVKNAVSFLLFFGFVLVSFSINAAAQAPAAPAKVVFTEKDREFALKYLNETKEDYNKQLGGLSDAQLNFRSGEGRWTIAEIAEHITVTEGALYGMITNQLMKAEPPKCESVHRFGDTAIVLAITNRSQKFTAPEQIRPAARWKTRDELLSAFDKARATTIDFMTNNKADLRNMFMQNPFGMMDGVQWFIFLAGHSDRHLAQVKEVKADSNYPKR